MTHAAQHFFFLEKRKPVLKEKLLSLVKLSFLKKVMFVLKEKYER